MVDPIKTRVVHEQTRRDFHSQRKHLREVRLRQIEQHEEPKPMVVVGEKSGRAYRFPFEIGKQEYHADPDTYKDQYRNPERGPAAITDTPDEEQAAVAEIVREALEKAHAPMQLGVMKNGKMVPVFEESPHPEQMEGESDEEWFARVSRSYSEEATEGDTTDGAAGRDTDDHR